MPMTRWEVRIKCLAGGNASATCLKMLVMRFADVQWPALLSLHSISKAHYKFQVIIITIHSNDLTITINYSLSVMTTEIRLNIKFWFIEWKLLDWSMKGETFRLKLIYCCLHTEAILRCTEPFALTLHCFRL